MTGNAEPSLLVLKSVGGSMPPQTFLDGLKHRRHCWCVAKLVKNADILIIRVIIFPEPVCLASGSVHMLRGVHVEAEVRPLSVVQAHCLTACMPSPAIVTCRGYRYSFLTVPFTLSAMGLSLGSPLSVMECHHVVLAQAALRTPASSTATRGRNGG